MISAYDRHIEISFKDTTGLGQVLYSYIFENQVLFKFLFRFVGSYGIEIPTMRSNSLALVSCPSSFGSDDHSSLDYRSMVTLNR